jgi:hypothetical protein
MVENEGGRLVLDPESTYPMRYLEENLPVPLTQGSSKSCPSGSPRPSTLKPMSIGRSTTRTCRRVVGGKGSKSFLTGYPTWLTSVRGLSPVSHLQPSLRPTSFRWRCRTPKDLPRHYRPMFRWWTRQGTQHLRLCGSQRSQHRESHSVTSRCSSLLTSGADGHPYG